MTSSTGTNPRVAGLIVRERLGRLSDDGLRALLAGPDGGRTADAVLVGCGTAETLPRESADDLVRIDGVTPRTAAVITTAVCTGTPQTTPS